jgi:gamma-glutamylcyclotransferase (GGCT)/AIG2-like uncharacterized protein YtfP
VTPDPLSYPLFVYGTLRAGCRSVEAERLMVGARLLSHGSLRGCLYRVGEYPGLVLADTADPVSGELYWLVSTAQLSALDAWETADADGDSLAEYRRCLVTVHLSSGAAQLAWVYLFKRPVAGLRQLSEWPEPTVD